MPLSIVLASAALLLAAPTGFLLFLFAFQAIGPWRSTPQCITLPDLADER